MELLPFAEYPAQDRKKGKQQKGWWPANTWVCLTDRGQRTLAHTLSHTQTDGARVGDTYSWKNTKMLLFKCRLSHTHTHTPRQFYRLRPRIYFHLCKECVPVAYFPKPSEVDKLSRSSRAETKFRAYT